MHGSVCGQKGDLTAVIPPCGKGRAEGGERAEERGQRTEEREERGERTEDFC